MKMAKTFKILLHATEISHMKSGPTHQPVKSRCTFRLLISIRGTSRQGYAGTAHTLLHIFHSAWHVTSQHAWQRRVVHVCQALIPTCPLSIIVIFLC